MDQNNIMFMGNMDNSYTMLDLIKIINFLGIKVLTIIMILMLKKYR